MELETKYNIGDVVWFVSDNVVCASEITQIKWVEFISGVNYKVIRKIHYCTQYCGDKVWSENELFDSKEALIESL